ncbi:MAG: efflux RND transporter permease subunit [Thermodesulfobacteriota bacterium]
MSHKSDEQLIADTQNTARFSVENRHISWVLLFLTLAWGVFGYLSMPQRKDPVIPVRIALAMCQWPGVKAEKIEELITRKIESKIAENEKVDRVESVTRTGLSIVTVLLQEKAKDTGEIFDDINLKLNGIKDLPEGAGPITFIKDFGATTALMLTVASPQVGEVEVDLRSREAERVIRELRAKAAPHSKDRRASVVVVFSYSPMDRQLRRKLEDLAKFLTEKKVADDIQLYAGPGLAVLDAATDLDDSEILAGLTEFIHRRHRASEFSPDIWWPVIVRDPATVRKTLTQVAGSKYTYRDLEAFTDEIARTLERVPLVSKVARWGVQREAVYLEYSQERLASYDLQPWKIKEVLAARNTSLPGGVWEFGDKNLIVDASGEFKSERELGGTIVSGTASGAGSYLRDIVDMERAYESPPENLNYLSIRNGAGRWQRLQAITLAVNMREHEQIGKFSRDVDQALASVKTRLPEDLIMARTSDQPQQVQDSVGLFMTSLYEAIGLVVLVAFVGFWEWRSAFLLALSIPLTLAMTFGMMHALGVDLQQVSIASLVIALGLLVDDPVVANDAIKNELDRGHPPDTASWLGPTKLARAILYATITNIVAYLPYLLLTGDTGRFLYTLPVVLACSLVASRVVSMSFMPLLAFYLFKARSRPITHEEDFRSKGFSGRYYRMCGFLVDHRWRSLAGSLSIIAVGFGLFMGLKPQFFPKDLSYLCYVDVWLPEDAPIMATQDAAWRAEELIRKTAEEFGRTHADENGKHREVLRYVTTFIGGGGPRFWYSVEPEMSQPNYAQILLETTDKRFTEHLVDPLQEALMGELPGVRLDMRQLESGPPVGFPVQVRISGEDIPTLRSLGEKCKQILRNAPNAYRVSDNWGAEIFQARLKINPDKANLAGVTNADVAMSSSAAINGFQATTLREGRLTIPVIVRLRAEERTGIEDIKNLYVYASAGAQKVPLGLLSTIDYGMETEKIFRREHFRTIKVSCFPAPGVLPSEVIEGVMPRLEEFKKTLPPGYSLVIGGEYEEQVKGFSEMSVVLTICILSIYLALVFQFRNAVKPLIVFAALPFGIAGAFVALWVMGSPFGFMAYLGIVSLIGVIVSHIIVLFDYIEDRLERGEDLRTAVLDAGIARLRPVLITVGATVIALIPLAINGGPLWEPLCYAQIGGLTIATFVTLLMVPVLYCIVALDLKLIQ